MNFDVIVVGAGPAGAGFALCADKKLKILMLDGSGTLFGGVGKPCGGLLAPDAQKILARLGLSLPAGVLVSPQIFAVKTIDVASGLIRNYPRSYLNMDRRKFDLWLMSLLGENVTVKSAVCKEIGRSGGGFEVTYRGSDGQTESAVCKYLVGADGARSIVRRFAYPHSRPRMYTAIQQWFHSDDITPFYSCIFDSEVTDCCSWSICKDNMLIFGGAYPSGNCRARFELEKQKLAQFGFSLAAPEKTESCTVLRPSSPRDFFCGKDGIFLVGEAAGFVSPSSLEGTSWAMRSGRALATALTQANPNRAYIRATAGIRLHLSAKMLKCPFMYNPFLRRLAMKSGIGTI